MFAPAAITSNLFPHNMEESLLINRRRQKCVEEKLKRPVRLGPVLNAQGQEDEPAFADPDFGRPDFSGDVTLALQPAAS